MADLEGSNAVEPVEESIVDESTADNVIDQTEGEAPSEAPSEELTDSSEPDEDGSQESSSQPDSDDDDDKPVITRRNAKQIAEQAVADALAAKERAADLERQLEAQKTTDAALTSEMESFIGSDDEITSLRDAISKPIPVVDDAYDLDSVQSQQQAIRERNAAMERLNEIGKRQELLPKMLGRVRSSFAASAYEVFDAVATAHEGVDRAVFVDHLAAENLPLTEVKARMRKAFDHLYEAGKTSGANEWKGRYEAEKKQNAVLKASAGGVSPSPESGGKPGQSRIYTADDLATMSTTEYRANAKEIERQAAAGLIK